jgi:hypothetical protein
MEHEKTLKEISMAVRDYNGQIARWKTAGYKGDIPPALLSAIADLYATTEKFFGRKLGEF